MTPAIIRKLARELNTGIETEVQVVYLLAGIRKLIERDKVHERYAGLKFHCDWVLHSSMDRAAARAILKEFDAAHVLLQGNVGLDNLPKEVQSKIDQISKMEPFKEELSGFLAAYELPPLTRRRPDGWTRFLHLYSMVIEDIPLLVSVPASKKKPKQTANDTSPKHISHVTVQCEFARETLKHAAREKVLFKVTWTIYDKSGGSGEIFIINSFSL
jgi:hypothetical protein